MPPKSKAPAGVAWHNAKLHPVVLLKGPEDFLGELVTSALYRQQAAAGNVERETLEAAGLTPGALDSALSPSLFSEPKFVLLDQAQDASAEVWQSVQQYAANPQPDTTLVLWHRGGNKALKLVAGLQVAGVPVVLCDAIKWDNEKMDFIQIRMRAHKRKIDPDAARALLEALGSSLRELSSGLDQLVADTAGDITAQAVRKYYGGRIEAGGFDIADAAISGDLPRTISLLRHGFATGLDPVPVVAVVASRVRSLAKVLAGPDRGVSPGMSPWQMNKARQDLRRWDAAKLGRAITALAVADEQVKGASRDPHYAVEQALIAVASQAR